MDTPATPRRPSRTPSTQSEIPTVAPGSTRLPAVPVSTAGKYQIVERLGAGGMGEVWKAWDPELRRWVAVKFLVHGEADEIARFRREAQLAARLAHPNIAAVYDVGEAGGRPYLAMQYIDGFTLKERIGREPREAVAWIREAALAAAHAHSQGVVHRDLKPENIMVAGGRAYVMDFGLARCVEGRHDVSVPGTVVGTPTYMSPEQARGERAGPPADVWALGASLYHLVTGQRPFVGKGLMDILRSVRDEDPVPPRRRSRVVDADLEAVILKCLEKRPSRRYPGAAELAEDLRRWLDGEPVLAAPPSRARRAAGWVRRHRVAVAALAVGLIVTLTGSVLLVPPWLQARRTADRETARRRELELYAPIEKELDLLRMKFYQPEFALTDREFGEYRALEERIRAEMRRTGESAAGWYLVGRCREVPADLAGAEEAYRKSLEVEPGHWRSRIRRGRLHLEELAYQHLIAFMARPDQAELRRRAKEAAGWIEEGIRASGTGRAPEVDYAARLLDLIDGRPFDGAEEMKRWQREPFVEEFLLLAAQSALLQGDPRGHRERLEECLRRVPSWHLPHYWSAVARPPGGTAQALDRCRQARRIHPRFPHALLLESILLLSLHQPDAAEPGLRTYVRERPDDARGWIQMSALEMYRGRLTESLRSLDRAVELSGGAADALAHRAEVRLFLKDHDGAWADVRGALREAPGHPYALLFKATLLEREQRVEEALQTLQEALRLEPDFPEGLFKLSRLCQGRGDAATAMKALDRCLELHPHFFSARVNRGGLRRAGGDLDGALEDFNAVLEMRAAHPQALVNRAAVWELKGDLDRAIRDLDLALTVSPPLPEAFVNRGLLKRRRGDPAGAREDFRRCLEVAPPDWPHRTEVERYLQRD